MPLVGQPLVGTVRKPGVVAGATLVLEWVIKTLVQLDRMGTSLSLLDREREFSTAVQGDAVPGRAGTTSVAARSGCVIIATVTNDESDWNPPGALPGLGTWATITSVTWVTEPLHV